MPKLILQNLYNAEVEFSNEDISVLHQLQERRIDWMHACGGKGRCTTCKMIVLAGSENLSELTKDELNYLNISRLKSNERLACQCRILAGEVVARIPDAYKLSHLHYSD
jgi:ferredoxin, 2Fe-2S